MTVAGDLIVPAVETRPLRRYVIELYFPRSTPDGSLWVVRRAVRARLTLQGFRDSADPLATLMGFSTHVAMHVCVAAEVDLDATPCPPGRRPS